MSEKGSRVGTPKGSVKGSKAGTPRSSKANTPKGSKSNTPLPDLAAGASNGTSEPEQVTRKCQKIRVSFFQTDNFLLYLRTVFILQ